MADKKLRIPRKLKIEQRKHNYKIQYRHDLGSSIWVCSSNFTNTTSWAKELGAMVLPILKSWGGGQN